MKHIRVALIVLCALIAGCDSDAARMFGFAAPRPPKPAVAVDIICDSRGASSCTASTLGAACDEVLPKVADRPGSTVTVWGVGETVADTTVLASVTVPDSPAARRAVRDVQSRFLSAARATILAALSSSPTESHRTPLAEAITRVAWSHPRTSARFLIVITDGLEETPLIARMECGALPDARTFVSSLAAHRVLTPGTLSHMDVQFAFVTISHIDHDRCEITLERADAIRTLWIAALKSAGAQRVNYFTGPPQLTIVQEN